MGDLVAHSVWLTIGGAVTGSAHTAAGIGCQDAHGWFAGADGSCCLVVADGAGSRPDHSAGGAAAAVDAVLQLAKQVALARHPGVRIQEFFAAARQRIDELAEGERLPVDEYATTLGVVLVHAHQVQVGQVGDSIIVLRGSDGALVTASPAERSEYANETVFITETDWLSHLREDAYPDTDISAVALSTDGLRWKILDDLGTSSPYAPFFEDVFAYTASESARSSALPPFLDGLDDQSGDDKTLVVAVKSQSRTESPADARGPS